MKRLLFILCVGLLLWGCGNNPDPQPTDPDADNPHRQQILELDELDLALGGYTDWWQATPTGGAFARADKGGREFVLSTVGTGIWVREDKREDVDKPQEFYVDEIVIVVLPEHDGERIYVGWK